MGVSSRPADFMDQASHNKIISFIWSIVDDVLRALFVRSKYRDIILPMCALRGLLQHLEVQHARPQVARQPAAVQGRRGGHPRRLLAERAGHSEKTNGFLLTAAWLVLFLGCEKANNSPRSNNYEALVESFTNGRELSASLLIATRGEIKLCKSYGMADYAAQRPNTPNTQFYISSMTKPMTAIAVMQLAEKGLINTPDPVTKYLPEFVELNDISILNLLTHSSGLVRNFSYESLSPSVETISQALKGMPLEFQPGSRYSYSSVGYYLLGMTIEKVTGQTYESSIQDTIFKPASMSRSGCGNHPQVTTDLAVGHSYSNGNLVRETMDMNRLYSAGCVYSTAIDMYLLDRALYNQTLLNSQTLAEMYAPMLDTDVENRSMGLGWAINKVGEETFIEHAGLSNGYNSLISRRLRDESVIILLSNISNPQVGTKELIRYLYANMASSH